MRPLVFLFPHSRTDVGGNSAQLRFLEACERFTSAQVAYYGDRAEGRDHLEGWLRCPRKDGQEEPIFVIHWGPDVAGLIQRLRGRDVVYVAHSTGWGMDMPPEVPILCVSRHTLAYWGRHAPNSHLAWLPNVVESGQAGSGGERDIDVLVQTRKSSPYLLDRLVPSLSDRCRVTLLDGWVDDLATYMARSKVYLYDSVEHWIAVGASEGFGLPPMEALAQGCTVFSSVNDALADYLDPGINCRKLRVHSLDYDVESIMCAVSEFSPATREARTFGQHSAEAVSQRLELLLTEIEDFFARTRDRPSDIADPRAKSLAAPMERIRRAAKVLAFG